MSALPFQAAHSLQTLPAERRWLIDGLWADQGVGIVGGEPKCCKSFLALDMAVSVASKTPCLRRYPVKQSGRVLLYAAEDALHVVRTRLEGICRAAGVSLANLDIQVITADSVRLDLTDQKMRLTATIDQLKPRLLVLDPFVRLHRIDENASAEVAPLLAYLRELQRRFELSVVVAHHAKKGASSLRGGQALRGSSEFHAWGDSNLYLRRIGDQLSLSIEHRAAASTNGINLKLTGAADSLALTVVDAEPQAEDAPLAVEQRVLQLLTRCTTPVSLPDLRSACGIRKATLLHCLSALLEQQQIRKTDRGYVLNQA